MQRWIIDRDVPGAEIGYRAIVDQDGYTVCRSSAMGEEAARLIVAAPQLLALLRDAREALLDGRMDDLRGILAGDICTRAIELIDQEAQQ